MDQGEDLRRMDRERLAANGPYLRRAHRPNARLRLLCVPFAGAGASMFHSWIELLPPEIELAALQLPGREDRVSERPFSLVEPAVGAITGALRQHDDLPTAIFGHSSGALLAFEVACRMSVSGSMAPRHLFVAGHPAPDLTRRLPMVHSLPDDEFVEELHDSPLLPEASGNSELMAILLPTIRADFALWERYVYRQRDPLSCPVTALGGEHDERCTAEEMMGWERLTTGTFRVRRFPGAHFFVDTAREQLVASITADLL